MWGAGCRVVFVLLCRSLGLGLSGKEVLFDINLRRGGDAGLEVPVFVLGCGLGTGRERGGGRRAARRKVVMVGIFGDVAARVVGF